MSAILGRIEYSGRSLNKPQFDRAFKTLSNYGPDGKSTVYGENFAFGLHHFDVKAGRSDGLELERNGCILTADAIIDAGEDLAAKLEPLPSSENGLSDFELIRGAYLKWGQRSPDFLFGDYAFAVFNPETQELFLARDHIGKRPLYWARRDNSFTFSTDIAALLEFDDISREIDQDILLRFMVREVAWLPTKTLIKGINFVDPGCYMTVGQSGQKQKRWWNPHDVKTVHGRSAQDCVQELTDLLTEVMEDNIDTKLPVGAHLSGGIDSGAVTALSARALRSQDRSLVSAYAWAPDFSDDFPDKGKVDERHNINRICESSGISIRFGSQDYKELEAFHQREFEIEGFADLTQEAGILSQASHDGVRILLSGWGGDEAFSTMGRFYLPYCLKRFRFAEAFRVLRIISGGRRKPKILLRSLYYHGLLPLMPEWLKRRLTQDPNFGEPASFIHPIFLKSDPSLKTWWYGQELPEPANPKVYLAHLQLYGHLAERADTWAAWSSRFGIQYRYPLMDRRIMEFILGVPNELLFADGKPRFLARHATKDVLPDDLQKYDVANEALRSKRRLDYWKALLEYERVGMFDGESSWLDMPKVREVIRKSQGPLGKEETLLFRRLSLSIRIWYLEQRNRSISKKP